MRNNALQILSFSRSTLKARLLVPLIGKRFWWTNDAATLILLHPPLEHLHLQVALVFPFDPILGALKVLVQDVLLQEQSLWTELNWSLSVKLTLIAFLTIPLILWTFLQTVLTLKKGYGVNTIIALNSINADTTSSSYKRFDTTMKCKVCNATGHSFNDCLVVRNVPFIKTAFIKTSLFLCAMEKDQAKLNVDVAAVDSDAYHTAQDVASSNESAFGDSEPEDFYQGD